MVQAACGTGTGNRVGPHRFGSLTLSLLTLAALSWGASSLHAAVNLEWRVEQQIVPVGEIVEIRLYAVSDPDPTQKVNAMEVIMFWDSSVLELLGNVDPCDYDPCPQNTYNWMSSGFPRDANGDGLNADCSPTVFCSPYTLLPFNDGNAIYLALGKFAPEPLAVATSEGLWVTTFVFRTLRTGIGELRFVETYGQVSRTLVSGGSQGTDVTGLLGPPVEVLVIGCPAPSVSAIGSRYLAVTPSHGEEPVALLVTGNPDNVDVACISMYVQADGRLDAAPIIRTPLEWGSIHVGDLEIIPDTTYSVQTVCGLDMGLETASDPVSATTWLWGDANNSGVINFDDIMLVVDGSQGIFSGDTIMENVDLVPCTPDGNIDADDVAGVQDAVSGGGFPCPSPCFPGPTLDDFAEFVACMDGPAVAPAAGCEPFDADVDIDVDLVDFASFQNAFGHP